MVFMGLFRNPIRIAGGTTLCTLARINGMVTSDHCMWTEPRDPMPAETQLREFMASNWTFLALEYSHLPLEDELLPMPGDVVYITTMRHPLERIVSRFRGWKAKSKIQQQQDLLRANETLVQFATSAQTGQIEKSTQGRYFHWSKQAQNFYHHLLGCCSDNGCTQASLAKAKRRLEYFSVLMISDDPDSFASTARLLGTRLGWRDVNVSMGADSL